MFVTLPTGSISGNSFSRAGKVWGSDAGGLGDQMLEVLSSGESDAGGNTRP